ncbi:T9SS type A sorting domain-containing protein [Flavobacterium sedimenticola]|uniref:T9SS type A sorting domain-containing protein n=1 Tax=Flavobacterium sedimenticola TaxID=3043286 RepID=A0ABT6XPB4_9FLAO|nr:T9SS type A sorting domain-containing protein [Flavobacterium sedimenticola]MDI9256489.1 T9SS type A sorting domain-containing protein [Flavobacterium sedimenticola]
MKQLLLLFLFTVTANAQFQTAYPPLEVCDDNNDQFAVFDLTQLNSTILATVNPTDYTLTYHESFVAAQNNTGIITTPNSFVNTVAAIQTIGIRILNNSTSVVNISTVDIRVLPIPVANPGELFFCDPTELAIYNLEQADLMISNGNTNVVITYYDTLTNAQLGVNPLPAVYIPIVNPGTQTLFARVERPETGCFAITTLTLNTQNCFENCQPPTNLTATSITNSTVTLGWTSPGTSSTWEVLVLPIGSPNPTSATNGIFTQTNPFTITGLNPQTCYLFFVRAVCANTINGTWSSALEFCTYDCTNNGMCPESLTLVSFLDINNNGSKDVGESGIDIGHFEYEINNSGTTLFGYPDHGVFYIFDTNPTNSYDIAYSFNTEYAAYFNSATAYTNITLPTGSGSNTLYFPILQTQTLNDLEVRITPNGNPRPGFTYGITLAYKNKGTETVNTGTISFTKSPVVSIVSVSETGTIATASGFEYTFSNLLPNEERYIYILMQVPTIPTVSLGDIVTHAVSIEPLIGDAFPNNNNAGLSQTIVGSYDPNDKAESHGGRIVFDDFTSDDYLYYTIRFENTGTAEAEFIRVEDVLDADLDETTFEMLASSHTVNTRRAGSQLTWHFYNINLPPTATNPNDSHGYIHFRLKPRAGYVIGDIIPNTASIFFDYNPPIVTNTFNTEFVESLGVPHFDQDTILLYPNPADEMITLSNTNASQSIKSIVIYEITGKRIYNASNVLSNEVSINSSNFAKGLYLLEVMTDTHQKITKKLIIK